MVYLGIIVYYYSANLDVRFSLYSIFGLRICHDYCRLERFQCIFGKHILISRLGTRSMQQKRKERQLSTPLY